MKRIILLMLCVLVLSGCGGIFAFLIQFAPENKYTMPQEYEHTKFTDYSIRVNARTETGIRVDTSGKNVDLKLVDVLTKKTEQCMQMSIARRAFILKIAPDEYHSKCAGQMRFPCKIQQHPGQCPGCAGILQYPSTLIVTADLAAYMHELIHLITRSYDHTHPGFKKCGV